MSIHNDIKGTGANWSAFEEQLNKHTDGLPPPPIDNGNASLQKYHPQNADAIFSQRLLALQLPQFQVLSKALREQNAFSESQGLRLLQCASKLDQSAVSQEAQKSLIIWSKTLKNILGDFPFYLLFEPKSLQRSDTVANIICAVQRLINLADSYQSLHPSLVKFNKHEITLKQLIDELDKKKDELDAIRFPEKPLEDVRREFSNPGNDVKFRLSDGQIDAIFKQYEQIHKMGNALKALSREQWACEVEKIRKRYATKTDSPNDLLMLLAIGREAFRAKFYIYPYNTQILTILGILMHDVSLKGRIAQVRTGEGKSTISTLLAFVRSCQGKVVDLVSSSRYLASRDAEKYESFFKDFDISISHICEDELSANHFRGQIIYGTNFDFEFALMRDRLGNNPKRKWLHDGKVVPRPFEVVIVDEVDNLFIDSALSSARIATPSPERMDWIYHPILAFVKANVDAIELESIIHQLRTDLGSLKEGIYKEKVSAISDKQLKVLLTSAYEALYEYLEKRDYIIQRKEDPLQNSCEASEQITIVDWNNTGRLMENSRWQCGLHQFIEAKHGLPTREEGLTVASLSHPVYFGNYQNIYGLTGTLGLNAERQEILKMYSVDSFDVPSHRKNQRTLLEPLTASTQVGQYELILEELRHMLSQERPVLILCETIQESLELSRFVHTKNLPHQLLNERQAEKEDFIIARAGEPKMVTIATNTAGRGTDIVLHPKSRSSGGLHVIFAFVPLNTRVQEQGIGRAARQGDPGSARLILKSERSWETISKEREEAIALASLCRMARVESEKMHHQFLEVFWKQLSKFYETPLECFIPERVQEWLKKIRNPTNKNSLIPMTELLRASQDPGQPLSDKKAFGEAARNAFAELARQHWAHAFYNQLHDLDPISVQEVFNARRSAWESIFDYTI